MVGSREGGFVLRRVCVGGEGGCADVRENQRGDYYFFKKKKLNKVAKPAAGPD